MRVLRYGRDFSRRHFLGALASGAAAGVLMPAWQAIAQNGDSAKAYPEELLSIDAYTKGRIKTGDEIHAGNVDLIKELIEPIKYIQIKTMGRRLRIVKTTTDITRLSPIPYLEATLRNRGQGRFDATGNVVTADGKPWIGGLPFPDSTGALEMFAGLTLSWGRHDASLYAIKAYALDPDGDVLYNYETGWAELSTTGRTVLDPKPYLTGHEDRLRLQSVFFMTPMSAKGTSFLNVWPYDQNSFPDLYGYVPEFRRVRQFPTDQRFEPLITGSTIYLSDAWAAGDPLNTWGNYRTVGRGPILAAVSRGWNAGHPNWEHKTHGGPKGKTFWDTDVELIPEAIETAAEPVKFPRAPVGRKHVWFDARTQLPVAMVSYDRRGEPFHSFDGAFSLYEDNGKSFRDGAYPYWSWAHVHAFDVQTSRMTRLEQVKSIAGGHDTSVNNPKIYDKYLTKTALVALGLG